MDRDHPISVSDESRDVRTSPAFTAYGIAFLVLLAVLLAVFWAVAELPTGGERLWTAGQREPGPASAPGSLSVDDYIQLHYYSTCEGTCPEYVVTLRGSGHGTYEGIRFVCVRGQRSFKVPMATMQSLFNGLSAVGFARFPDETEQDETDHQASVLTVQGPGLRHRVEHYWGDLDAPPVLFRIYEDIDRAAKVSAWTESAAGQCGKDIS